MDVTFKRQQFERLKELNDNGRLIPEKRKGFTGKERKAVYEAYQGRCEHCDRPVGLKFDVDHIIPLFRGGKHEPANWALLCKPCHLEKTGGEAPGNAKIRRIEKREIEGPKASTIQSAREIQSRGFDKTKTRTFGGQVKFRKARA